MNGRRIGLRCAFFNLHFLSEIEDCFHIQIDEMEYEDIITVGDVIERIRETQTRNR